MQSTNFDRAIPAAIPNFGHRPPQNRSINFHDARRLHHGRLFLSVRKLLRSFAVNIHAREFLAVRVINGYLPMMVFAPFVVAHSAGFLWLGFFHVE
jgi:hypothetical protein